VFPFNMFPEVDPVLGPEMRSTGEVLGLAPTFGEAFAKSQEGVGAPLPRKGTVLMSISDRDKDEAVEIARMFVDAGLKLVATGGTAKLLSDAGLEVKRINKQQEGRPNITDAITNGEIQLLVNTPSAVVAAMRDDSYIRQAAIRAHIPYMTTMAAGRATALGILQLNKGWITRPRALQDLHASIR
ncbi:MAG: carbamoyl phosphate synthase large subunit, partial [Atopobiaceae bacterium]|nr:carbamoyl phosphate synthase large subunit [Atopobiaceae bacterium]